MTVVKISGMGMTSARTRSRLIDQLKQLGIVNKTVLDIMSSIPRHLFVDEALAHRAYDNGSLPIGQGQTISSPYIVAKMTECVMQANKLDKVLEIGTGCGYQTAVLAQCFKTVYSIERISTLLPQTRHRLNQLNIHNVRLRHADGMLGWPEMGLFDAIIVTAAASQLPETLASQLAVGGKMIFPFGQHHQELKMIGRTETGFVEMRLEKVNFVPLLPGTL